MELPSLMSWCVSVISQSIAPQLSVSAPPVDVNTSLAQGDGFQVCPCDNAGPCIGVLYII